MATALKNGELAGRRCCAAGRFGIADQHRAVAAQQCCDPGRRKLGIELAEILRRDRNDGDAGEPAVDFALAADREKLGVGGAGVQQLGDKGTVHRVVVVNLEIVPVREVDSRHREHRAGDQRIAVGADDPEIAQLRHRRRHRAKPLGMGCFVRADLLVRGGAGGFVEIAGGKLEGLEHLLRMFVHDRKIAAQTVARLVEMLMVRNRCGDGIQRDRQHDRAE